MSSNPDSGPSSSSTFTVSASQPKKSQATSCAECRRLKLKCDRVFPCSSCIRRGCANLCPNGILEKGRRGFLKRLEQSLPSSANRNTGDAQQGEASTEVAMFIARDAAMSKRIQELETALINAGVPVPGLSHGSKPSRKNSVKNHKRARSSSQEIQEEGNPSAALSQDYSPQSSTSESNDVTVGFGTLTIDPGDRSRYIGLSGASAYLDDDIWGSQQNQASGIITNSQLTIETRNQILERMRDLPPYGEAIRLANLYFDNLSFMYEIIDEEDFFSQFRYVYEVLTTSEGILCPDVFALVGVVLALGQYFDLSLSSEEVKPRAMELFKMAAFALNCHYRIDGALKLETIQGLQAVHLMTLYQLSVRHEEGAEPAWQLLGMVVRSIYAQGFHRDGSGWGLPTKELELRRRVFWETYTYDRLQAFTLGRPHSQNDSHCDCKMPTTCSTPLPSDNDPTNSSWSHTKWHIHKFRWAVVVGRITDTAFSVNPPTYSVIMQLDREINDFYFSLPQWILCPSVTKPVDPAVWRKLFSPGVLDSNNRKELQGIGKEEEKKKNAQIYTLSNMIFFVTMHLHRGPFCRALMLEPQNLMRSRYEASVARVISSSTAIINITRGIFVLYPKFTSRVWYWVFHSFTAAVCQAVFVIVAPFHPLATAAFRSLQAALELFENASGQRARSASARLSYLACKAAMSMQAYRNASQQAMSRKIAKSEASSTSGEDDIEHESESPIARFPESNVRKNPEVFLGTSTKLIRRAGTSPPPIVSDADAYGGTLQTPSPPSTMSHSHEYQPQSASQESQQSFRMNQDPFAAMMGLYDTTPAPIRRAAPEQNVYSQQAPYPTHPVNARENSFSNSWLPTNGGISGLGDSSRSTQPYVAPKFPESQSSVPLQQDPMDASNSYPTEAAASSDDLDSLLHQFDWKTIFYLQNNGVEPSDAQARTTGTGAGAGQATFNHVNDVNANVGPTSGIERLNVPLENVPPAADASAFSFTYGASSRFNEIDSFNLSSFIQDGANAWMYDPSTEGL